MAIIKESTNENAGESGKRRKPSYTVGGNVDWYSHCAEQYGGSLKTKNRATMQLYNPTTAHISREKHDLKGYMHPSVHCSTIYSSQDTEAT